MADTLKQMYHLSGCRVIANNYKTLMETGDIDDWAYHFQFDKNSLAACRGDFTTDNLMPLFKKIFEEKCQKSLEPLEEQFCKIWEIR